eukprot:CAMPEP_0115848966 /NCGR_PEP_ID=MMETSP0287-20121206/11203_1 /TAXON_ID=412157 /ORGANISM="Chrysochromulina rotalis, Strain UIO044" /LENGTH=63 /DNA_ID=CAMNT_0003302913 /DNA_START=261 /DNA_END=453 /DNA_ORIENTATION=+
MEPDDATTHSNICGTRSASLPLADSLLLGGCALRESGDVDPQLLVPPFKLAGKKLAAVAAFDL